MENAQPITYKQLLIHLLISQTTQVLGVDIVNQPSASESLRNVTEAMTFLKQSEICVVTEKELDEATVRTQLEGLVQKTIYE